MLAMLTCALLAFTPMHEYSTIGRNACDCYAIGIVEIEGVRSYIVFPMLYRSSGQPMTWAMLTGVRYASADDVAKAIARWESIRTVLMIPPWEVRQDRGKLFRPWTE